MPTPQDEKRAQTDSAPPAADPASAPAVKRPYRAPQLTCLGTVEELTQGTGGASETEVDSVALIN